MPSIYRWQQAMCKQSVRNKNPPLAGTKEGFCVRRNTDRSQLLAGAGAGLVGIGAGAGDADSLVAAASPQAGLQHRFRESRLKSPFRAHGSHDVCFTVQQVFGLQQRGGGQQWVFGQHASDPIPLMASINTKLFMRFLLQRVSR